MNTPLYELIERIDRNSSLLINRQDQLIDKLRVRLAIADELLRAMDTIMQSCEIAPDQHNDNLHDMIDRTDRLYDEYLNLTPL